MSQQEDQQEKPVNNLALDLDFTPQWAREMPGTQSHVDANRLERDQHGKGRRSADRRERPARAGGGGDRERRRPPVEGRGTYGAPRERSVPAARVPERAEPREEFLANAPVDVSFLPERRGLGVVVRRMQKAGHAFPLPDVAALFLGKPEFHLVKIEVLDEAAAAGVRLFQCRRCERLFESRADAVAHLIGHLSDEFEEVEQPMEPPTGSFPCIVRCTLNRELVAPPNHHSYRERLRQLHESAYANMPFDTFCQRMETVQDQDLVEQWRASMSTALRYRSNTEPEAEPLSQAAACAVLLQKESEWIHETRRVVVPGTVVRALERGPLRETVRAAFLREDRFPRTMMNSLRPALRHMNLHCFKIGDKATYVSSIRPVAPDMDHAVPLVRELLQCLHSDGPLDFTDLVLTLRPHCGPDDEAVHELRKTLHWLVERGHVIAFSDGRFALPHEGTGHAERPPARTSRRKATRRSTSREKSPPPPDEQTPGVPDETASTEETEALEQPPTAEPAAPMDDAPANALTADAVPSTETT